MLEIIETKSEARHAQELLQQNLRSALASQGKHNIGYPGGNEDHEIFSEGNGLLYCAFSKPQKDTIPRYWNSFGVFNAAAPSQQIVVEINVPLAGENGRVAAFFAKDSRSGKIYLMHSGRIGGGRKGIGKWAFLNFLSDSTVEAIGSKRPRSALVIGDVEDRRIASLIWRFVKKVEAFKSSDLSRADSSPRKTGEKQTGFKSEFSGRKRGARGGVIDYFSYHGMIVDELKREREISLEKKQHVGRDQLVDLFVAQGKKRVEICEVKTSADRQSFYTAIGQLMTHAPDEMTKRVLVMPRIKRLPVDCLRAIKTFCIEFRTFTIKGKGSRAHIQLD